MQGLGIKAWFRVWGSAWLPADRVELRAQKKGSAWGLGFRFIV